jgi:hypothetical protein
VDDDVEAAGEREFEKIPLDHIHGLFLAVAGLADGIFAGEDGAGADGQGWGGDVAFDFGFGADEHRAAADDVAFDFPADDEAVAQDLVGHDDIALLLDGNDAADFDRASCFILRNALVFEAEGFAAELAGDRHRLAAHLLRFIAVEADDGGAIIRLRDVVFGGGHAIEL